MMKVCLILVAFACLAGVLNAQYCSNAYCPSGQCYQVVPGDTVGAIVGQNSYCVSQVGTANNINVNNIYPGELLCIPSGCSVSSGRTYSTPTNYQACSTGVGCAGGTCYTVQSGNTVSGIVGGSISCINSVGTVNGINTASITPGQVLCIPSGCYSYSTGYTGNTGSNYNTCANGASCSGGTCYTVQSGNTVSGIVGGNTNCISSVGTLNNINVNNIYPGEALCIPSGCNSYASAYSTYNNGNYYTTTNNYCPGGTIVTVQSGNTVGGFVGGNQNCINAVATANNLANVNSIYVGESLCIPSGCNGFYSGTCGYNSYNCASASYVVKSGDTCQNIANAYGISLAQLYACNPNINSATCGNLYPGEVLYI